MSKTPYPAGSAKEFMYLVMRVHVRNPDVSLGTLKTFSTMQLKALLGDPKAQFRANQLGLTPRLAANCGCQEPDDFMIRVVANAWDESKHPRADDGKWADAGGGGFSGGGSRGGSSSSSGGGSSALRKIGKAALAAAGIAAGAGAGAYLGPIAITALAAVRGDVLVSGLAQAAMRLGPSAARSFGTLALPSAAGYGAAAGGAVGALATSSRRYNAEAAPQYLADLGPIIEAVAKGDTDAAIAALEAYRDKYQGDEEAAAALKAIAAEAEADTPDDNPEELRTMHSFDEAVRDRLPHISARELSTFSAQQKRAIVSGMPATRVPTYGAFQGSGMFIPVKPGQFQDAAPGSTFVANQAITEGTRGQRLRANAVDPNAGLPSSFVANPRIRRTA